MTFFIPVIIILGVMIFALGGDMIKDLRLDFSIPDVSKYLTPQAQNSDDKTKSASSSGTSKVFTGTKIAPRTPPPAPSPQPEQTNPTLSPWFEKITISSFAKPSGVKRFQARLQVSIPSGTSVSLTGWRLKSKFQGETTFGLGIEKYHPALNNRPTENITLQRYDTVYVSGEPSPIGRGIHFRTNSCFGYLRPYYPSLPGTSSCSQDRPTLQEVSNLAPACQEFILNKINFSSCTIPNLGPVATNTECVAYINSSTNGFNYVGCYEKRKNESNFLSREWYIYSDTQLGNSLHDTITLFDQNGLIVDSYIY
ncbi:MAG: hypothetical protein A2842_01385 [Candidatus Wildermuthbacteria bacterium RIFCSPHIGHO2_01_FULL_48_25]|uniref:LTD domain-containing protein n=1 Tax=Candidatus Wildermuthbacteria bacterium RIFCSPLOWO2_01_FULL_48_16 TaxID=1802461 RepID=A0A1G2RIY6_9BACT|nr:MAG: hypothetical protein A2842_01385 [Candidatus Wildermuthbacteria bacterium RIFCSPHIGHO2_01_FULL_48_25]OHA72800.1 MAG: hypothetical protein A3B24_02735 [Candidatus Wildermuthbacteria bacterium RIFCSPLOWO2_01_FULL_48_16]